MDRGTPTYYIVHWLRYFFGAHLLFSGGRYILTGYMPEIPGIGGEWANANAALGLYQAVKYMEFVFGAMLAYGGYLGAALKPRLEPLALWQSDRAYRPNYSEQIHSGEIK